MNLRAMGFTRLRLRIGAGALESHETPDLGRLLVGGGEDVLKLAVARTEFVTTTLLGLDALPASGFLTGGGNRLGDGNTHVFV